MATCNIGYKFRKASTVFLYQKLKQKDMTRDIIIIDDEKCNGCGSCVPNCHEGALQIIEDKVRLVSELMCDGLGACIGHCPTGALTIEKREVAPYDEIIVIKEMAIKGKNTIIAHLNHLKDHNELGYMKQGVNWLIENKDSLPFAVEEVISVVHNHQKVASTAQSSVTTSTAHAHHHGGDGCPGSAARSLAPKDEDSAHEGEIGSQLRQWPVQMHLINPGASYFKDSDFVLAADCAAFAYGDFHRKFLKGKTVGIACPKLDQGQETYTSKLVDLINESKINTLQVVIMEVPCCGGLLQLAKRAVEKAGRKVPIKCVIVGIEGNIVDEYWA